MAQPNTGKPCIRHIANLSSLRDTPTAKKPWPLDRKIEQFTFADGSPGAKLRYASGDLGGLSVDFADETVVDYFGINEYEANNLFGPQGCGDAKTPKRAARFIEKFVAAKK